MPTFAIIAHDRADAGTLRAETRPRHLDHLRSIEGQIVAVGPFLSESEQDRIVAAIKASV